MKTDAIATKKPILYIYEYYNIFSWTQSPVSIERSVIAKIINSFTDGLNKIHRVPKYLVVIPDKDIIDGMVSDFQAEGSIDQQLQWLINNIQKVIARRREDLKDKRSGALACSFEPMVIWVKMIERPQVANAPIKYVRAWNLKDVFNNILENNLLAYHYMYIVDIKSMFENQHLYFLPDGRLSDAGKVQFWKELDFKIKKFNRRQLDLKPQLQAFQTH